MALVPLILTIGTFLTTLVVPGKAQQTTPPAKVLIFSATADFRHDSIPTAIQAMMTKGPSYNIQFDNTEDQTWFSSGKINQYDALVFLDNTGQVLDDESEAALQTYVNAGGNFVGIHAASDCQRNSTFYGNELGAHFDYHPAITNATVDVLGPSHPSTAMLPKQWQVFDEMYNFKSDPRSIGAIVILSADESTYSDPGPRLFNQGEPHPTAWFQEKGAGVSPGGTAGRSFYTSLGHTNQTWMDELYLSHVMGGISWVLESNTTSSVNATAMVGSGSSENSSSSSISPAMSSTTSGTSTSPAPTSTSGSRATYLWISFPLSLALTLVLCSTLTIY